MISSEFVDEKGRKPRLKRETCATRALFLDARDAINAAPQVAACLAAELGRNAAWQQQIEAFSALANGYVYHG